MPCDTCANLQNAEVRCEQKKEADLGNRLQSHSKVKMSALPHFSQWHCAQGRVHRQRDWTQKVKRMKLDVCEAKEEQMVAINSDEAKSLLQAAFGHIGTKEEKSEFKQSVLEVLMKADKHKNDQDKMDGNEISLFTSQICEMLDAESHKLSGNDKQVRFDHQMKRLALAYFLDYGKAGYNRLKESSLEILPSQRTNECELSCLRGEDGAHAVWFSAQFVDALQIRKEPVKVRCGVAYNPITGKETGFTTSKNGTTLSFAEEIFSIFEDSLSGEEATATSETDKDQYFEPAAYDNCNRLSQGKPPVASVAYTNPLAPFRLIYAPFGSVHGLKHSKNMLAYRLLVNEGKLISWKEVIALYRHLKENCEYSMNVHELRGLRRSVAYPDQFTQQNVNDAKKAFEEEMISCLCQWLANKIGCTPDFFYKLLEEFQNKDGCGDEILEGKVQLLRDKLSTLPAGSSNKVTFENTLAFIEKWAKDLMEGMRAISMSTDISEIQKVSIFPPNMTIDDKMKSWLNVLGKAENGSSYSEILMDNDVFNDYAAALMLKQGIKEWFKKIIPGQADAIFDNCRKKKRARSKRAAIGISFHVKLFKMLQHKNMNGVISVKYAESKMAKEQGKKKHLDVRDVNKILGIEEEESENGLQLQKEIDFLSSMRFDTEEALQSQVYLDKCYDSFLRSSNRGRLTLVNEQYFHFGVMLMKKVSASVDQERLGNDPDVTANAKGDIWKNGNVYLGKLSEKKKIFAELVDKVINARFSEEIRAYKEEHTARGTKYKGTNLTMREEIDVIGSRKRASNRDAGRSIEERKEE
eukprot:jgi/Psemu1/5661/gm1.5661_g